MCSYVETYSLLLRKYDFQCANTARASYSYLMAFSKKSGSDGRAAGTESFDITSAPKSLKNDLAGRQRRYLISMIIRTVCFLLTVALPSPYRWFALAGAIGAGTLITGGTKIPPGSLVVGSPGRVRRALSLDEQSKVRTWAEKYVAVSRHYLALGLGRP